MTILRLHHVQFTVPPEAEQAARDFYLGALGLSEVPKPDSLKAKGGFWINLVGIEIHISLQSGLDRHQNNAHLAYQVDDLAAWREKLLALGVEIGDSIPIPGCERFEFRDPFGNRVEFIKPL